MCTVYIIYTYYIYIYGSYGSQSHSPHGVLPTYLPNPQIHLFIVQFIRRATSSHHLGNDEELFLCLSGHEEVFKNDIRTVPSLLSSIVLIPQRNEWLLV